jgi:hypothetical protein
MGGDPLANPAPTLLLADLSRIDVASLRQRLPEESVEVREEELAPGELGEPATIILLIGLSVASLTGICSWLAMKGKDVKLSLQVQAPGGFGGSISLEITGADTPADVQARIEEKGVTVPLN